MKTLQILPPKAQALSIEFKLDEIKGDSRVVLS